MLPELDSNNEPQPLTSEPLLSTYDYVNIFFLLIVAAGLVVMCCGCESQDTEAIVAKQLEDLRQKSSDLHCKEYALRQKKLEKQFAGAPADTFAIKDFIQQYEAFGDTKRPERWAKECEFIQQWKDKRVKLTGIVPRLIDVENGRGRLSVVGFSGGSAPPDDWMHPVWEHGRSSDSHVWIPQRELNPHRKFRVGARLTISGRVWGCRQIMLHEVVVREEWP